MVEKNDPNRSVIITGKNGEMLIAEEGGMLAEAVSNLGGEVTVFDHNIIPVRRDHTQGNGAKLPISRGSDRIQ